MAEIRDDHIKCDKSDPWLKIKIPARLLYWVDEAADYRGISTEELVNELLYDNFGKTYNAKGELRRLHKGERKKRRQLTTRRYILRTELQKGTGKTMTPLHYLRENDRVDWGKLEELRRANIKRLDAEVDGLNIQKKQLDHNELMRLTAELESRGIKRTFVRLGDNKVYVRHRKKGSEKVVCNNKSGPVKTRLGKRGFIKGSATGNDAVIAEVKDACRVVGADSVLKRIETFEEELRAERLKPNNHTV